MLEGEFKMLKVLYKEDILKLLKEKYGEAELIKLYIDYADEAIEGNDQIIAEINLPQEQSSSERNSKEINSLFDNIFPEN